MLKLVSGAAADRAGSRKRLVALGYGLSALTRPVLALATHPFHAVLVRAVDRVGKGLRGPPRDAILAAAVVPERRGHAFGFHRMMDNAGAVVGGLGAFVLLRFFTLPLRTVFAAAFPWPALIWRTAARDDASPYALAHGYARRRISLSGGARLRETTHSLSPRRRKPGGDDASPPALTHGYTRRPISARFDARLHETTRLRPLWRTAARDDASRSALAHGCARRRISLSFGARLREAKHFLSPWWRTAVRDDASRSAVAHGYARRRISLSFGARLRETTHLAQLWRTAARSAAATLREGGGAPKLPLQPMPAAALNAFRAPPSSPPRAPRRPPSASASAAIGSRRSK